MVIVYVKAIHNSIVEIFSVIFFTSPPPILRTPLLSDRFKLLDQKMKVQQFDGYRYVKPELRSCAFFGRFRAFKIQLSVAAVIVQY